MVMGKPNEAFLNFSSVQDFSKDSHHTCKRGHLIFNSKPFPPEVIRVQILDRVIGDKGLLEELKGPKQLYEYFLFIRQENKMDSAAHLSRKRKRAYDVVSLKNDLSLFWVHICDLGVHQFYITLAICPTDYSTETLLWNPVSNVRSFSSFLPSQISQHDLSR